jgi:hydrogenase expression/formation protein HypE
MAKQSPTSRLEGVVCPLPLKHEDKVVLGHGSGGKLTHDLIRELFLPRFANPILSQGNDAGIVELSAGSRLALSTDSHVVAPLTFRGGDIGRLAVCGTVNDLAVMGARPVYLTAGFIIEEGFDLARLVQIVSSMREAAAEAGIQIVAGDTKVVQRGKADGLYINTSGVGLVPEGVCIAGDRAQPGDVIILSGPIGDHGIAVLAARGELGFEVDVASDTAPLNRLIAAAMEVSDEIHVMRDPTRGGVATTLNEIARQSQVGIVLQESAIPVRPSVQAACEMLGFDPLHVANEGKFLASVKREHADRVLERLRSQRYGKGAVIIGEVAAEPVGRVLMRTAIGGTRVVDMLSGEMLPRIC